MCGASSILESISVLCIENFEARLVQPRQGPEEADAARYIAVKVNKISANTLVISAHMLIVWMIS
jgi:hypothetical protein